MTTLKIMSDRPPLSRRQLREIDRQEKEMYAEIGDLMKTGLSFDEAWIASGGQIWTDEELRTVALLAQLRGAA